MADLIRALRDEVRRQARKELREVLDKLKQTVSRQRKEIASLKKHADACEKRLNFLEQQEKKRLRETEKLESTKLRFSAKSVKSHRTRLGLSAGDYGKLLGVSGQTVYQWERGTSRPRKKQIAMLAALRSIGKKESRERLRLLGEE